MDKKCCKDFEEAESSINSALVLASTHGFPPFKKPFTYCPYCKTKLSSPKSRDTKLKETATKPEAK